MLAYDDKIPSCMKVLSNPTRLDIFLKILERCCDCDVDSEDASDGNCVTQIGVELEIPQPTVSNHVKELVNCGLVHSKRRGRKVFLFVNEDLIDELTDFFDRTSEKAKENTKTCS